MSDFNEFKGKASSFASRAAEKAKDFAIYAANKTKQVSRITKLNVDIAGKKDIIKHAYAEIGKLYYETHHDSPDGFFIQLCEEIDIATSEIEAMETEIAELKATVSDSDAPFCADDVDFETVVDETAADAEATAEAPDIEVEINEETCSEADSTCDCDSGCNCEDTCECDSNNE